MVNKFKIVIGVLLMEISAGCAIFSPFDSALNMNTEKVLLLGDTSGCTYLSTISPNKKRWREGLTDTIYFEVNRLKGMAIKVGGNSIAEIKIYDRNSPIGSADVYNCPELVVKKQLHLQKDKNFPDKIVKIID